MNKKEIIAGLKKMGLQKGGIVLLHSSLSSLGQVEGGAQAVVDAFLEVLGESGTLVVPAFGSLGIIADIVKNNPQAVSSIHPLAGVAAIGADAEKICRDHWKAETAHAENTPCARIAELGGYVCLLGVDQDRNTTLHTVEALLRLPYLKPKQATFATPEGEVRKEWPFFPGPHRDFIGLDRVFRASGKMKIGRIGNSVLRLIKSRDLIDIALEAGRNNPAFVLCDNPHCADCRQQRADIYRYRMSQESFRLAAASSLAGRYIPEMIENMKSAGIDLLELDYIEGLPVHLLSPKKIQTAVRQLRDNAGEIAALRSCAVSAANMKLLASALECKVSRVLFPLAHDSAALAEEAQKQGVVVSFYNLGLDSPTASTMLLDLKNRNLRFDFTFNAASFAAAGEKPFLSGYKQKLRRFVNQLDVEDALWDGSPAPLAGGNAEIKEMISILRCAGFSGWMTLGARNRYSGTLADAAARFGRLLETM